MARFICIALALFSDLSSYGQAFQNVPTQNGLFDWQTQHTFGAGCSFFDFNLDGLDDMTYCFNGNQLLLYENNGNGFDLVPVSFDQATQNTHAVWVDYDNDGDMDLFVSGFAAKNRLYRNNGSFVFSDATVSAGLPTIENNTAGVSFGDYDRDGYLDLFVAHYADPDFPMNPSNRLYHNNGDGTFTDVTTSSGLSSTLMYFSFISVWVDLNEDLWPDIYVINDKFPGNTLFMNNGDGTFTNTTAASGSSYPFQDPMSATSGDYDNDGDLDIYMSNSGGPLQPPILMTNLGDGTYEDVATAMGLYLTLVTWGATWIDYDNDTWQDLYVCASSHITNYLYHNEEGESFTLVQDEVTGAPGGDSYSSSKGDFNNDGYADLIVSNNFPGMNFLLENVGGDNHYAKFTLEGTVSNKLAVGSWIKVYINENKYVQYTLCGEGYLAQNSQHQIFGLGDYEGLLDSVIVTYNSGHTDVYYDLPVDSSYQFTEGETYAAEIVSANGFSVCEGDTLILDAGVHTNYLWNTGETGRFLTVTQSGSYEVEVSNTFGINALAQVNVFVNPIPVISYELGSINCFGDATGSILLENQVGIEADFVNWNNEMNGIEIDSLPAGTYSFEYMDINGCNAMDSVEISEPSELILLVNTSPEISGEENGSIVTTIFGGTPPYTVLLNGDTASTSIQGLTSGTYLISVLDQNGCIKETETSVEMILSTLSAAQDVVRIYPNPSDGIVFLESSKQIIGIQLYSSQGRKMDTVYDSINGSIDFSSLASGIYFAEVQLSDGSASVVKLLKSSP